MRRSGASDAKNAPSGAAGDEGVAELVRRGVAAPPRAPLDVERFLKTPAPRLTEGASASEIVVAERQGGRD